MKWDNMTAQKDTSKLELYATVSNEKFFKFINKEYGDGMKTIKGKIGIVCDIDLEVSLFIALLVQ